MVDCFYIVVRHAVSLLVSAAFTDGSVRSSLLQQSNFKPWLQQLVLLAKEVACLLHKIQGRAIPYLRRNIAVAGEENSFFVSNSP